MRVKQAQDKAGITLSRKDWVFDNYKEPINAVENGFGYYGVVIRSKDKELVKSNIDGLFYPQITYWYVKKHGFENLKAYKDFYGISHSTPLCGKSISMRNLLNIQKYLLRNPKQTRDKLRQIAIKANKSRTGEKLALEIKNKRGTCPDQLLQKLKSYKEKYGYTPTKSEFKYENNSKKHIETILDTFGTWTNAITLAGLIPANIERPSGYNDEYLLECLRTFFKNNGYTPLYHHFGNGVLPGRKAYYRHFKSLNIARRSAGIPEVINNYSLTYNK